MQVNLAGGLDETTPIACAVKNGNVSIAKMLLARDDIELNKTDAFVSSCFLSFVFLSTRTVEAARMIIRLSSQGHTALWWATNNNHKELVVMLLAVPDVNVSDHSSACCGVKLSSSTM